MMGSRKKFVVYAPAYEETSGGCVALYKLNSIINELGHSSIICEFNKLVHVDDDSFVIYPEIVYGNPLMAKNVIRWCLNKPGVIILDASPSWGEFDHIFYYSSQFGDNVSPENTLFCFEPNLSLYQGSSQANRDISNVFLVHKSYKYESKYDRHPSDAIRLDSYNDNMASIIQVLLRSKNFYSYDVDTYYSVIALLCGCKSFVIKKDGLDSESFFSDRPLLRCGVKYDEVFGPSSDMNIHDYLISLEQESMNSIKRMIQNVSGCIQDNV